MERKDALKKELAERIRVKREIEDWLEEKVSVEHQIQGAHTRLRALGDDLTSGTQQFEREKKALESLISRRKDQLR